ncbi:MAG: glycosyltransferase [Bacteroidota bacterium]
MGLAVFIYVILFWSLVLAWLNIPLQVPPSATGVPISIIIAAHNEEGNLPILLPCLLAQLYPAFEVILVLDRCTDHSLRICQDFQAKDERIRIIRIEEPPSNWSPKKWAIHTAIHEAKYEWLAFTDADCTMGNRWLSTLAGHLKHHQVVLGVGVYEEKSGLLNQFIQYETLYTAFQYIGAAKGGIPYMAVGRNLAYQKQFFTKHDGFLGVEEKLSGDDDLLINAYANTSQTACMIQPESLTYSVPKTTFSSWFWQKTRHVSASHSYSFMSKGLLALFHLSMVWFYMGILLTLVFNLTVSLVFTLYICRLIACGTGWYLIRQKLPRSTVLALFPLWEIFMCLYHLLIVPVGLILTPKWKK